MLKQVMKTSSLMDLSQAETEEISREILRMLYRSSWKKRPPAIARDLYGIVNKITGIPDPYKEIKSHYNREIMALEEDLRRIIRQSPDSFSAALKLAISGNLIDFGTNIEISREIILNQIDSIEQSPLVINHSEGLKSRLSTAGSLLYLGDNCGEIVFDKIFIEFLLQEYPQLDIRYVVRGAPIINDVTRFDADETGLSDIVEIMDNGDSSPGTIIGDTSPEFQKAFYGADVIISKGQGNYESLNDIDRQEVFMLFMAKCEPVASSLGVKPMSLICVEK